MKMWKVNSKYNYNDNNDADDDDRQRTNCDQKNEKKTTHKSLFCSHVNMFKYSFPYSN